METEKSNPALVQLLDPYPKGLQVQVKFERDLNELEPLKNKCLLIPHVRVPLTRFGTWIFKVVTEGYLEEIVETVGPLGVFVYSLHKEYPQISAWMDDISSFIFTFDCNEEDRSHIFNEIVSGRMSVALQDRMSSFEGCDLELQYIKVIGPDIPEFEGITPTTTDVAAAVRPKDTAKEPGSIEKQWLLMKQKAKVGKPKLDKKDVLKNLIERTIYSMKAGTIETYRLHEIKSYLSKIVFTPAELSATLTRIRGVTRLLRNLGAYELAMDLLHAASVLVKKIKKRKDRVDSINTDIEFLCEMICMTYQVKDYCIVSSVTPEDELRAATDEKISPTHFEDACKAQCSGKRAFKQFNFNEALQCYNSAIKMRPKMMLYLLDRAEVYLARGEMDKTFQDCKQASALSGSDKHKAKLHAIMGEMALRSCHIKNAISQFEVSLSHHFNHDLSEKVKLLSVMVQLTVTPILREVPASGTQERRLVPIDDNVSDDDIILTED